MFDGFKRLWKGIRKMFDYTTLKGIAGQDIALSQKMIEALDGWRQMLDGNASWIMDPVESLRIESGICREFADAVLVEMDTGIQNNDRLDKVYQHCIAGLNENLQDGLGLGSFVLKPLGPDHAEFVTADKFIPVKFTDEGKPLDFIFLAVKQIGKHNYTRAERHYFVNGSLTIENKCYHSQSRDYIGAECSLSDVPEWERIAPGPITYRGMDQMDFGYYRNPIKNTVDGSNCGVSIFDSAKERIKLADIQAARLDWEYDSGERAIHVDSRALKKQSNKVVGMAKLNRRLYRGLELEDGKDKDLLKEYSPDMRDDAYIRGLERYYRSIEFIVGLAYGDLSEVQEVAKTATEIKTSKARKYNRVTAIQENLKGCLEDFAAGLAFYNGLYTSGYEFGCKFNDSILTDEETERQNDRADVAAGFMQPWEYRAKWYNEDETTAKRMVMDEADTVEK